MNDAEGLHLIGITSFYIASKAFDRDPVHIKLIKEIVVNNKFTYEEIKDKEAEILTTISFMHDYPTSYELINQLFTDFMHQYKTEIDDATVLYRIKGRSIYIAFMCCYEYEMLIYEYF